MEGVVRALGQQSRGHWLGILIMDCGSSRNPINSLSSLTAIRPTPNAEFSQEFLQHNSSQVSKLSVRPPPNPQWKEEFLNGAMTRLTVNETTAFDAAFNKAINAKNWNEEFIKNDLNWEKKFDGILKSLDQNSAWENQFKEFGDQHDALDWNDKFNDIFGAQKSKSSWETEFMDSNNILDPDPVSAPSSEYIFEGENPFMNEADPLSLGLKLLNQDGHLSQAALAFEAAVQRDPGNSLAWFHLGTTQAENEKEGPAIAALERSVKEDPQNAPAFMALAVSYTNEGMDLQAYMSLKHWVNIEYPSVIEKHNPDLLVQVTSLFLDAARHPELHRSHSNNNRSLDADVQTGLGVLFYNSGDFDKAIDCFNSALSVRPNDYKLWSRLGATLANSGNTEEAIDAYYKALKIRPTFVRGRYNLGVGCINIGCYKEAAEHFLGALSLHGQNEKANISNNLWETLRRTFVLMERHDLCDLTQNRKLELFKNEFDF